MKYTLAITRRCNLACGYCYIDKSPGAMSLETARNAIDFVFRHAGQHGSDEVVDIGFFGGEPLLEFGLMEEITRMVRRHPGFGGRKVVLSLTTNGTIFTPRIERYLVENQVMPCISCDGPASIHDRARPFRNGRGSYRAVGGNIKKALKSFPLLPVNAVFTPETLPHLPETVGHLASLGVRNVYFSPDISAKWSRGDADLLPGIYGRIARMYVEYYRAGAPRYMNQIDGKIAVILRGGFKPREKCRMGHGEFAFAPSGNVYMCERLIGADDGTTHCLGNVNRGLPLENPCAGRSNAPLNPECLACGLRDYCMNWCGCTNYSSTGNYNRVSPFTCAMEKAAIVAAHGIIEEIGEEVVNFSDHASGAPIYNIVRDAIGDA